MPSCLIVENDGRYIEQIRNALASEGWPVHVAGDPLAALEGGYEPAPDLVFVNAELEGADNLLSRFSRKGSPSCSIALQPEGSPESQSGVETQGDEVLIKPFEEAQLWAVVRILLSARFKRPAPWPNRADSKADFRRDLRRCPRGAGFRAG